MVSERISIVIEGQDNASDDIRRVQQNMQGLENTGRKTGSSMGGLTKMLGVAGMAGAAVAAGAALVGVANELNTVGTSVNATRKIFQQLTGDVEDSYKLLDSLKSVTNGVVSEMDLMTGANQFMRMGLAENAQEVQSLIDMAVKLKNPTQTAGEAINDFALMLANQSVERLDSFGISSAKVRAEMELLLETGQALNREEAFKMATFSEGAEAITRLGDAVTATDTAINKAKASMEDYKNSVANATASIFEMMAISPLLFFGQGEQQIDAITVANLALADAFEALGGSAEEAEKYRQAIEAYQMREYQQEAFRFQTQIGSDERTAGTLYSMTPEQLALMENRLEASAMRLDLLKSFIETEQQALLTLSTSSIQQLGGGGLDEETLRAVIAEFDAMYARIEEARDVAATMQDNEYLSYLDDVQGSWENVEASIRQSYANMQKLADIRLMSLDELLGRGAGDRQQVGLVDMILGQVSDSEIRDTLQSSFALLTGQETELGQVVQNEIASEIARVAQSMGAEISFGMVEAVQNALQTGEYLGMSDDEIIEMIRGIMPSITPGPMPAPAGTGGMYTVQPGDSPWSILANMGIPASQIQGMMGMFAPYGTLQPGMQIGLPGMGGVAPAMPYQNIFGMPTDFPSFLTEGGEGFEPIESIISEQAMTEVEELKMDFEDIDSKMTEIQTRVSNAFRDRSMRVTVNVDFNIDEEGRSIWEASGGNRYNDNLGQPTQTIPGGSSRTS